MRIWILLCAAAACVVCARPAGATCRILEKARIEVSTLGNRARAAGVLEGQPVSVLVDTGSTASFITRSAADRLHLTSRHTHSHIFGVAGPVTAESAYVRRLQVGSFVIEGEWLLVKNADHGPEPDAGADLVLGEDRLSRYATEFDLGHGLIRLLRPEGCQPEQLVYWSDTYSLATLTAPGTAGPQIVTEVVLSGQRFAALLDTGAQVSMITLAAAEEAGFAPRGRRVAPRGNSNGIGNNEIEVLGNGTFDTFSLGDEQIRHAALQVAADLFGRDTYSQFGSHIPRRIGGIPDMLIGCDFFLSHRLLVLFPERMLLFSYEGGPVFQTLHALPDAAHPARVDPP